MPARQPGPRRCQKLAGALPDGRSGGDDVVYQQYMPAVHPIRMSHAEGSADVGLAFPPAEARLGRVVRARRSTPEVIGGRARAVRAFSIPLPGDRTG